MIMTSKSLNTVLSGLAIIVAVCVPQAANGQSNDRPSTPADATVYLQNVTAANLGLAAVLVKTQEFGAKVAARSEAAKLPGNVRSDITDHLSKYVTVTMPQPYEARLLAFEVRNCPKEAASVLASAVASAYLDKLAAVRREAAIAQSSALEDELAIRRKERDEVAAKAEALTPKDIPSVQQSWDALRTRMLTMTQEQTRLELAKIQADAAVDLIAKSDGRNLPQVRLAMDNDSALAELQRQRDAVEAKAAAAKDDDDLKAKLADLDKKIAARTQEIVSAKVQSAKTDAQNQRDSIVSQLTQVNEKLASDAASAKSLQKVMREIDKLNERQSALNQAISRIEDRMTDARLQSDSGREVPKLLGKSVGE